MKLNEQKKGHMEKGDKMNHEMHPETIGRDNEDLENLQMFIPSIQNHLAHGYTPGECRQLLRVSDEQFESLLAAVSAVGENPYKKLSEDSLLLEPTGKHNGCVDEVNGSGAEVCPKFLPTKHELLVLAKYWMRRVLEVDYNSFLYQQSGSGERVGHFAMRRVGRIELLIGSEVIEAASDEVQTKFESEVDPELFDMFTRGEEPARDEYGVQLLEPIGANKGERDDISDVKRWEAVARRWILEFPPRERDWVDLKDPTWRSGENEDPNCP